MELGEPSPGATGKARYVFRSRREERTMDEKVRGQGPKDTKKENKSCCVLHA